MPSFPAGTHGGLRRARGCHVGQDKGCLTCRQLPCMQAAGVQQLACCTLTAASLSHVARHTASLGGRPFSLTVRSVPSQSASQRLCANLLWLCAPYSQAASRQPWWPEPGRPPAPQQSARCLHGGIVSGVRSGSSVCNRQSRQRPGRRQQTACCLPRIRRAATQPEHMLAPDQFSNLSSSPGTAGKLHGPMLTVATASCPPLIAWYLSTVPISSVVIVMPALMEKRGSMLKTRSCLATAQGVPPPTRSIACTATQFHTTPQCKHTNCAATKAQEAHRWRG